MRFLNLRLQHFRNIDFAEIDLQARRTFLLGANGQGKSNLLEALGLVTALRSFRTQSMNSLPNKNVGRYAALYEIEHDSQGQTRVELHSGGDGRQLKVDGESVVRLGDFIGRFPVVPLSSGDLMLLRGSPAERRRFLDLTFAATDVDYYFALRNYHRGVAERNRLLKKGGSDAELSAFEAEIAPHAVAIMKRRFEGIEYLRKMLISVYTEMADLDEGPELEYTANAPHLDVVDFSQCLYRNRTRDQAIGSTQKGPHRDDFNLSLKVGGAREYASDGQQRGLCVALRVAQALFFQDRLGIAPVILADDVLGELDSVREAGFWRACPDTFQIIASGTQLPKDSQAWKVWKVKDGAFTLT